MSLLLVLCMGVASADTAEEIVDRARAANQVESSIQTLRMVVVSKSGSERVKELELRSRRKEDRVSSYIEVKAPSDVAGTKLLMIDHDDQPDEQLTYLPIYKRVNQMSGSSRKGAFIGSDFSYEDLDIREAAEGEHTLVEENDTTWVIDTVPSDSPQYSRIRSHITRADNVARKVEFFDKKGEPLKLLEVLSVAVSDGVSLPVSSKMSNLQRRTHTTLEITEHQLNVSEEVLPDETFTSAYLER